MHSAEDVSTPDCAPGGEFATVKAIQSPAYRAVIADLSRIHKKMGLPDHEEFNRQLFPWSLTEHPEARLYATRLWEYPWAILRAGPSPGMECADVGCGMTPFTAYLAQEKECVVTGFDPDVVGAGFPKGEFGVNPSFLQSSNVSFKRSDMAQLNAADNSFDRVFCLSVIEHVSADTAMQGIREMARILKPGGMAIITMDLSLSEKIARVDPLTLVWESGLIPDGDLNLAWPVPRLGKFFKRGHAADVYGMALRKDDTEVQVHYAEEAGETVPTVERWHIPQNRVDPPQDSVAIPIRTRLKLARLLLLRGYAAMQHEYSRIGHH